MIHVSDIGMSRASDTEVLQRARWPFIERPFTAAGYAGERMAKASRVIVEIVRKPAEQIGFAVHPRRWTRQPKVPRAKRVERLRRGSSASLPGSEETGDSPRISKLPSRLPTRSSTPRPPWCFCDDSRVA